MATGQDPQTFADIQTLAEMVFSMLAPFAGRGFVTNDNFEERAAEF